MAVKLYVPLDLANQAIQEKLNELVRNKQIIYSGELNKTIGNQKFKIKYLSSIHISIPKGKCPMGEIFEFYGSAKLTYILDDESKETAKVEQYQDGSDYRIRGQVKLDSQKFQDDNYYIIVSIVNNTIVITNER